MEIFAAAASYAAYQTSNVLLSPLIVGWGAYLADKAIRNNIQRECPIRLPAARIHEWNSLFPNNRSFFDELSTVENSHWHWANLTNQAPALELIAKSMNSWGRDIVESAPPNLLHRVTESWKWGSDAHPYGNLRSSHLVLPPARGMLLVGPEGAGKRHVAQGLAALLFDHCWEPSEDEDSAERTRQPVLQILAEDHGDWPGDRDGLDRRNGGLDGLHSAKKKIVDHIQIREGLGSVVIVHHMEHLTNSLLEEFSEVLSGKSNNLSYDSSDGKVEAACDGVLFIFTSKRVGTRRIMQEIQDSGGIDELDYDSMVSSIRREVENFPGKNFADVSHSISCTFSHLFANQLDYINEHFPQFVAM